MALSDTFLDAVETIFDSLDDLVKSVEYHRVVPGDTYDPATNVANDSDTTTTVRGALIRGRVDEKDFQVPEETSARLIVPGVDLPSGAPASTDYVVIDSVRYEIITQRPLDVFAIIFYLRAP